MKRAWCRALLPLLGCVFAFHFGAADLRAAIVGPSVAESGSVVVTAETAEVREGPAPSYSVITVVEKGEVFVKQGRTGGWYYILINGDAFGWINGRAVGSTQGEVSPRTYVVPNEDRYYTSYYYPGGYNGYYWGQPYVSWEWYFYDRDSHWDRSWDRDRDRDRDHNRDRYRDRSRDDRERPDQNRTRNDSWRGDSERPHGGDNIHRTSPAPRSTTPRFPGPFRHR
jgi:hypothetical protein